MNKTLLLVGGAIVGASMLKSNTPELDTDRITDSLGDPPGLDGFKRANAAAMVHAPLDLNASAFDYESNASQKRYLTEQGSPTGSDRSVD